MATVVEICNRGLQKLGAARIVSLSENSVAARACNVAYTSLRDAELLAHPWNFAIERVQLAADATAPDWGRASAFSLPTDFLRLLSDYPELNLNSKDWQIEGRKIITNDSAPLNVRYVKQVTDPNTMDALFREALATRLALELCEELTQSNEKKAGLKDDYKDTIREARRTNAIQNVPAKPAEDDWITVRR